MSRLFLTSALLSSIASAIELKSEHHNTEPMATFTDPSYDFFAKHNPPTEPSFLDKTSFKNSVVAEAYQASRSAKAQLRNQRESHKPMTPDQFSEWLKNFYAQADKRRQKQIKVWEARDPLRAHFGPDGHYHPTTTFLQDGSK
jgi:hypothetical protein